MAREYTYNQLIKIFHNYAESSPLIRSFYAGDPKEFVSIDQEYPLLFVQCANISSTKNELIYDVEFLVLDRLASDNSNQNNVKSDTLQILLGLKNYLSDQNNNLEFNRVEDNAEFLHVGKNIDSQWTEGHVMNLKIRTANSGNWCAEPGIGDSVSYADGVFSFQPSLTCSNLTACTSFVQALGLKADLSGATFTGPVSATTFNANLYYSGNTPLTTIIQNITSQYSGSSAEYYFSANTDNNLSVSRSGNTIEYGLNPNLNISSLHIGSTFTATTGDVIINSSDIHLNGSRILAANTIFSSASTANNFISGATNLNEVFAPYVHSHNDYSLTSHTHTDYSLSSHTHSLSDILNTAHTHNSYSLTSHTHSLAEIQNTAHTHNSYLLTANTPYEVSYYRKRGSNLTRWYHSGVNAVANSIVAMPKDVLHYCPFIVSETQTINVIACEVTTFGSASSVARLGIFDSITNTSSIYHMQPNNVIADCGTVAIDSNGVKSISGLTVTLTPGLYFLTINNNSSTNPSFRSLGAAACPALFSMGPTMGASNANHLVENQTFGAFTSSTNSLVNVVATLPPIIAVQIS